LARSASAPTRGTTDVATAATAAARLEHRTVTEQISHWVRIGMQIDQSTSVASRRVQAVVNLLSSTDAFLHIHDFWGLDGEEAAEAVEWAIRTLTDSVRERGMP